MINVSRFLLFAAGVALLGSIQEPVYAQWSSGSGGIYYNAGNVGIGTTTPQQALDVFSGDLHVGGNCSPNLSQQGAYLGWNILTCGTGETDFINNQGGGRGGFAFINTPSSGSTRSTLMFITGGGNVGIGTTNPQYLLSVSGTIQAKEVIVNTGWSDYVFAPTYHLQSLQSIAAYVKEHHHLPGMPSETEVKDKGVSVGDVESKLLAKVEELTLHMIKLDEANHRLEQENSELKAELFKFESHNLASTLNDGKN